MRAHRGPGSHSIACGQRFQNRAVFRRHVRVPQRSISVLSGQSLARHRNNRGTPRLQRILQKRVPGRLRNAPMERIIVRHGVRRIVGLGLKRFQLPLQHRQFGIRSVRGRQLSGLALDRRTVNQ